MINEDCMIRVICSHFEDEVSCIFTLDVFECTKIFILGCDTPEYVDWTTYLINKKHLTEVK